MKLKLLLLVTSIASCVFAQEDITSTYLINPSFEKDNVSTLTKDETRGAYNAKSVVGWTLSGSYGVSDIMTSAATATDDNFGAPGSPSNGNQMYYIRYSWKASTATLLQSIKLPRGKYRLTVDNKCITKSSHAAYIVAGDDNTSLTFQSSMPSTWTTTGVDFELSEEKTINVGLRVEFGSGSGGSVLIDNFRLYDMADYVEPEQPTEESVSSPTEGVITSAFVSEAQMKTDLLQMLADFTPYMVKNWFDCQYPNSINEECGYFLGENSGGNNEQGVRHNADFSMICAFLVKYAKPAGITLPNGITYDQLSRMAKKSLIFAYSTHKANKLKVCSGNNYWGSVSTSDAVWESSLWAMSVAYSAYFQWDTLADAQKKYIYNLLKAECNYELNRSIPTGYSGDTKAEENGWEADILAATLGLFPNDDLASKWFERLREFAVNSYSHTNDASNSTVLDSWYNKETVADLYKGQNLYDDYSLQNHNLFHTSYQNVVMQELGEAALALKMFQKGLYGNEKWSTAALMHNNQEVQDSILNWLALADGELAMPNGNDWSLFLYDQITSYTTQACFQKDPNALMLENLAYKYIQARQKTTTDGSWLLRADVGSRRMGVEAHRVMMTYLMHDVLSTADITPTSWDDFNGKYAEARMIPCQNIVRAASDYRFTCFSWSTGLKSYTGYFAANSVDKNKILVPYRANNTGNITGWYEVSGKGTNATPVVSGVYKLKGNGYVMNGELNVNDASLNNRFAIYSTPTNALIYLDYVTANSSATLSAEKGGLLAISTDDLTKLARTLYYNEDGTITHKQLDGSTFTTFNSEWVNIDNELGVISSGNGKKIAFGDRGANNSIYTSKLYPMYSNTSRSVKSGDVVDARNLVYYSLTNAEQTKTFAESIVSIKSALPEGWNGVIAPDNECYYLFISNFKGENKAELSNISVYGCAPVFYEQTSILNGKSSATFSVYQNNSVAQPLKVLVKGTNILAQLIDDESCYITASEDTEISLFIGSASCSNVSLSKGKTYKCYLKEGEVCVESASIPLVNEEDYTGWIINPSFEGSSDYGWSGAPTVSYNCAEKYNTTFNVYQTISGLPEGQYILSCQGFYRDGGYNNAASLRTKGTEALNAVLYANDASVPLSSIFEDANKKGVVGVSTSYGYIPNTMEQTSVYFNAGLYPNSLAFEVTEGEDVTLGVKKSVSVSSDWTIFDNFKLTYLGKETLEPDVINAVKNDVSHAIYNIEGNRVNVISSPGIYIINGQKVLVK